MRMSTFATGAAAMLFLAGAPAVSQASWASRASGATEVRPIQSLAQDAPQADNVKFRDRADRMQGVPPYQADSNHPYAPPPLADPAAHVADPVYFRTVMGSGPF